MRVGQRDSGGASSAGAAAAVNCGKRVSPMELIVDMGYLTRMFSRYRHALLTPF
jgi:hypothetical protein